MKIAVASGKGGTGKTTVAVNLALSIEDVQFLDCDVEEPNANIFIKAKIQKSENVTVSIPKIDKEKCNYCGKCSEFCAYNALAVIKSNILVFPELCHSCGGCKLICPKNAVSWKKRVVGKVQYGHANGIDFYQGLLNIGEMQAIPVIKTLKRKVDKKKTVIIDVPPGTSCPVIESISNSDFCILVTEPTPFGLHDLRLAVEVVKYLFLPFGVIINRDGIGDRKVESYCNKNNIPILLKIPESNEIAYLYSKGVAIAGHSHKWDKMFTQVLDKIQEEVKR